jgi:hypothetical protein
MCSSLLAPTYLRAFQQLGAKIGESDFVLKIQAARQLLAQGRSCLEDPNWSS